MNEHFISVRRMHECGGLYLRGLENHFHRCCKTLRHPSTPLRNMAAISLQVIADTALNCSRFGAAFGSRSALWSRETADRLIAS
jgi:hypothetical protein